MATPRIDTVTHADSDVLHPLDMLKAVGRWFARLDREQLIATFIEWPGRKLMYALKLGRYPAQAQATRREENTVAGVLTWLYLLGVLVDLAID